MAEITMKNILLLALSSYAFAADLRQDVIITVNDKEYIAQEGAKVSIGEFKVSARFANVKTFHGSNYSFKIPSEFSLEKDETDKDILTYTFDGNNVVIDIYEINSPMSSDDFIDAVIVELNKSLKIKNPKVLKADDLKIQKQSIPGKLVKMPIGGFIQNKMFYSFKNGEQKLVISLQRSDDKEDMEESREVLTLLENSFLEVK